MKKYKMYEKEKNKQEKITNLNYSTIFILSFFEKYINAYVVYINKNKIR